MTYVVIGCFSVVAVLAGVYLMLYAKDYSYKKSRVGNIKGLYAKYSPDMNRYQAKKETIASANRSDLLLSLSMEQASLTEQMKNENEARELRATSSYIEQRVQREETVADQTALTAVRVQKHLRGLIDEADRQGLAHEVLIEKQRSQVKVEEHRAMEQIRLEAWMQEKNVEVKAALVKRLVPHYEAKMISKDLFQLIDLAYQLRIGRDPERERKLVIIEKQIANLQEVVDGRQGLLQGDKR